jgi:hypothetical protein
MNIKNKIQPIQYMLMIALFMLVGCSAPVTRSEGDTAITSTTKLTSGNLASVESLSLFGGGSFAPLAVSDDYAILNVTGEAVALLFTTGPNEGFDVFGPERPDTIQPGDADLDLVPFDLREQLAIASTTRISDNYVGAETDNMALVMGYIDINLIILSDNLTTQNNTVRIAFGSVEGMVKGDKLLKVGDTFQWYDLDLSEFTSTRPSNPAKVATIAEFDGSEHQPDMHFYSLNVALSSPVDLSRDRVLGGSGILNVLNFSVADLIDLDGVDDALTIDDAELITSLTLSENSFDAGSGISVTASVTVIE